MKKYIFYILIFAIIFWIGRCTVGNYIGEKKELVEMTSTNQINDGLVVVEFYATWCGPCKMQVPVIEKLNANYPDVKFYKVDVDKSNINEIYNVNSMPTIIIFKDKKEVERYVGLTNYYTISSDINNLKN